MLQRLHVQVFPEALKKMPTAVVSEATLHNTELHRWALSVVFTRCWGVEDSHDPDDSDDDSLRPTTQNNKVCHIAPIGDMLNHAENATTILDYDRDGNCHFFFKEDVRGGNGDPTTTTTLPGQPLALSLSYGRTTNPSRYLVLYGFVDTTQQHIFSQILVTHPTHQHKELGYDVNRMTLNTWTGELAQEVWDVTLYSILEQLPDSQEQFYHAVQRKDVITVHAWHDQYRLETTLVLKNHVDSKVAELERLLTRMDHEMSGMTTPTSADVTTTTGSTDSPTEERSSACTNVNASWLRLQELHPCWGVIRQHNLFMYQSFAKAQRLLNEAIQLEVQQRRRR